jgi:DNA-binding transcriptional ArsR family regulator
MDDLDTTTELVRLFGDKSRVRLLCALAEASVQDPAGELSVAELTEVTGLAQSRVSTHLAALRDAGLVHTRRQGGSSAYALHPAPPLPASRMWALVRGSVADPLLLQDKSRISVVMASRSTRPLWADSVAGRMGRQYSPGRTWESALRGLAGLVAVRRLLDVASGDGALAELIAPHAGEVICLDNSPIVVRTGEERLAHVTNLRFVLGDMHALPFDDRSFDAALLMSSLDYASDPDRVIDEVSRVLFPGGSLVGVALRRHTHVDAVEAYDHVQNGFEPEELRASLRRAGFRVGLCAATNREQRPPNFEIVTFHATRL